MTIVDSTARRKGRGSGNDQGKDAAMKGLRVNLISLIGAVLVLVSLVLPWGIEWFESVNGPAPDSILLTDQIDFQGSSRMYSVAIILVVGAIISALTPLGGFVPLYGAAAYFSKMSLWIGLVPIPGFGPAPQFQLGPGFYLAVAAGLTSIASMIWPVGPGYSGLYFPFSPRRLTVSRRMLVWTSMHAKTSGRAA